MFRYVTNSRDLNNFYAVLANCAGYVLRSMEAPQDTVEKEFAALTSEMLYEVAYFLEMHDDARIMVSFKDGKKIEFIFQI